MILTIQSLGKTQFIDITEQIRESVRRAGVQDGICHLFTPHTTAAISINENTDPGVLTDMDTALDAMVPWEAGYRHLEGNSAAHVKSSMIGCSELIPIENGEMILGPWQGIFFCEFDGPRIRKVHVRFVVSR